MDGIFILLFGRHSPMRNCASEGSRSESPESIEPQVLWRDGFSDVQLHIVARAAHAPE
jgi:hypothetical protein